MRRGPTILSNLLNAAVAAGAVLVMLASHSTSLVRLLDSTQRQLVRIEHLARYKAGLPLRGTPQLNSLDARLAAKGLSLGDPLFIRIFKRESRLELWMRGDGGFRLFATYPICYWSGTFGPKLAEGDRQAPEGFYSVGRGQLNPNSRWHRSFNLGFPNLFDRLHGRTGSYLMVHGGCSSVGCYAMTNPVIDEIWRLVIAALDNGQKRIAVHAFPFRLSDRQLAMRSEMRWAPFWRELKRGYDLFEATAVPPRVSVCRGRYVVEPGEPGSDGSAPIALRCPRQERMS